MKKVTVPIVNRSTNDYPAYAHPGDAGMDLRADFTSPDSILGDKCEWDEVRRKFIIFPGGRAAIPTGIKVALLEGYELQIRGRSGLAIKSGIYGHVGTLDAGYRGEVCAILFNLSNEPFEISQGDRIAQAVLGKFEPISWKPVDSLEDSDRGENGFGSTGNE